MTDHTLPTDAVPADTPTDATVSQRALPRWASLAIGGFFALFYVYEMWEAVGNLIGLSLTARELGTSLSGFGWGVLIVAVLLPLVIYVLAALIGRGRQALAKAAVFVVGLALVAVLSLDILVQFGLGSLIV